MATNKLKRTFQFLSNIGSVIVLSILRWRQNRNLCKKIYVQDSKSEPVLCYPYLFFSLKFFSLFLVVVGGRAGSSKQHSPCNNSILTPLPFFSGVGRSFGKE